MLFYIFFLFIIYLTSFCPSELSSFKIFSKIGSYNLLDEITSIHQSILFTSVISFFNASLAVFNISMIFSTGDFTSYLEYATLILLN